jgi:hypothetical protein
MATWDSEIAFLVADIAIDKASWLSEMTEAGNVAAPFWAGDPGVGAIGATQLVQTVEMDVLRIVETVLVTC